MNSIVESLIRNSIDLPHNVAFIGEHEGSSERVELTYQSLLERVREAAEQLVQYSPHCIALRAENSLDWVISDLAALYADIPCVPVPMFFTDDQVAHTLEQSGADLLVGDWQQWHPTLLGSVEQLRVWQRCRSVQKRLLPNTCKITFTSGSTGTPKGVCLSRSQLGNVSRALADTIVTEVKCDKHLVLLPLSTLLENITGVYVPMLLGATSVVLSGQHVGLTGSSQFDAQQFALALGQNQPNSLVLTPALLMALIQVVTHSPEIAKPLQFVAVGGARVSPLLLQHAHALGIPAYEGYGLSENASVVSLNTPSHYKAGTSGKPLPHVEVKITNDGEIYVSGCVALGYIDEPFEQSWYATGDLGHLDEEGYLVIDGRKKNQIITAFGRNISPEWVESEAQAFIDLYGIVLLGDGENTLTAVVESNQTDRVVTAIKQLNQKLPDYARIGNVVTTQGLKAKPGFYTSNGRPIRTKFEQWLLSDSKLRSHYTTTQVTN